MPNLFSSENINRMLIAIICGALLILFNMVVDIKHTQIVADKGQQQNIRQWIRIGQEEIRTARNEEAIWWIKKIIFSNNKF